MTIYLLIQTSFFLLLFFENVFLYQSIKQKIDTCFSGHIYIDNTEIKTTS